MFRCADTCGTDIWRGCNVVSGKTSAVEVIGRYFNVHVGAPSDMTPTCVQQLPLLVTQVTVIDVYAANVSRFLRRRDNPVACHADNFLTDPVARFRSGSQRI